MCVYGDNAVAEFIVIKWFANFGSGNFDLKDSQSSMITKSKNSLENNPGHMTWDITELLHISHMSGVNPLKTY